MAMKCSKCGKILKPDQKITVVSDCFITEDGEDYNHTEDIGVLCRKCDNLML